MKAFAIPACMVLFFAVLAKTQAQPIYRLGTAIVEKSDLFQLVREDSVQFYYSGNNGSKPTQQWLEAAIGQETNYLNQLCKIDPAIKYDSAYCFNKTGFKTAYRHTLDGNGDIVKHTRYFGSLSPYSLKGVAQDSITRTYATGKLLQETTGQQAIRKWHYSPVGKIDSIQISKGHEGQFPTWTGTRKFTYNSNSHIDTITNVVEAVSDYMFLYGVHTYASPGKVSDIVYIDDIINPAGLDTIGMYQYTYNSQGQPQELLISFRNNPTGTVEPYEKHEFNWVANDVKADETISTWNEQQHAWQYSKRYVYTYNSDNLPATATMQQWDQSTNGWVPWRRITLKYDLAWPLGIADGPTAQSAIRLYPNPATQALTIEASFDRAEPLTATILDMQGRVVRQWQEPATRQYHRTLPLAGIPAGNYVLKLDGVQQQYAQFMVQGH